MKTQTIRFRIRVGKNSWLTTDSYSKYYERLSKSMKGELDGDVYGIEQARDHVREYLEKEDEYSDRRRKQGVTIEKVTEIIEEVN